MKKFGDTIALLAPLLTIVSFVFVLADFIKFGTSATFRLVFAGMAFLTAIAYTFRYISGARRIKWELPPIVGLICWYSVGLLAIARYLSDAAGTPN